MKLKLLFVCLVSVFLGFACNTTNRETDKAPVPRKPATVSLDYLNPETGKSFVEEFQQADKYFIKYESTLLGKLPVPAGRLVSKEVAEMGVALSWIRRNPIVTFKAIREGEIPNRSSILTVGPIPINKPVDHQNTATVIVTKFADVKEVLDHPNVFTVRNYEKKIRDSVGDFMLAYDETNFNGVEKPWMRQIMPEKDWPRIRQIIRDEARKALTNATLIAAMPEGDYLSRIELVNNYARLVPIHLTQQYFGFTADDWQMLKWSRATQFDLFHNVLNDLEIRKESVEAGQEMQKYVYEGLIPQRRRTPRNDIISNLIRAADTKVFSDLNDHRITTNIIGTLVGNVETTEAAVVQSLEVLFRPENKEILVEVKRLALEIENHFDLKKSEELMGEFSKYVWEALRFDPVNPFVVRYAKEDFTLASGTPRQTIIKKGSVVLAGTHSAMFDEENFPKAEEFSIDRKQGGRTYFHLGYGHHRCLGDYVSEIQVPELVRAVLLLPGVHPASGFRGQVIKYGGLHPNYRAFPESFVVEYDAPKNAEAILASNKVQVVDQNFAFEDYLMDFNRDDYRECLSQSPKTMPGYLSVMKYLYTIDGVINSHARGDYRYALYWCRLKKEFRACLKNENKNPKNKFSLYAPSSAHSAALEKCSRNGLLRPAEAAFYRSVVLQDKVDLKSIPTDQAERVGGWEFEDQIKFYDRYTYRECFLNPAGLKAFPDSERMIFYARLPVEFRMCNGPEVLKYDYFGKYLKEFNIPFGTTVEKQYPVCKDGKYNPETGRYEGGLSDTEKFWYPKYILGRK